MTNEGFTYSTSSQVLDVQPSQLEKVYSQLASLIGIFGSLIAVTWVLVIVPVVWLIWRAAF